MNKPYFPPEVEAHAMRMSDAVDANKAKIVEQQERALALIAGQAPLERKYFRLMEIADRAAAYVAPHTPCRKGCSDCCYQAVPITLRQAQIMSNATGRPLKADAGRPPTGETILYLKANPDRYLANPKPCPFLIDNECSAYAVRPVGCRSHHVLHSDSSRCSLFRARDGGVPVPSIQYNLRWLDESSANLIFEEGEDVRLGDIRDFFQ